VCSSNLSVARRPLTDGVFATLVDAYLVIIQGGGLLAAHLADVAPDEALTTSTGLLWTMAVPLAAALVLVYGSAAALGRLRPVLRDDRPVQRWVLVVPVIFVVCILVAIDYGALSQQTGTFVVLLLVVTQLVGWGEEGMFRGLGVVTFREHGWSEGRVALWTSVLFGLVHVTNAISRGAAAVPQAVAVSFAGYFFYLMRRRCGTNAVNSVVHGLFDFALLSGTAILVGQAGYAGSLGAIVAYVATGLVVLVRRRHVEPRPA